MTIDERLEKLAERHEALAQSVELLTADVRGLAAQHERFVAESRERDQRVGKMLEQIMEGMARLLHIAEIHEQRIERLEDSK